MATNKAGRIVLIFTTFFLFAGMTALSVLNKYFGKDLGIFNQSTGDISRKYPLVITPPWPIYFIWYLVFALELVLILYGITTICRKTRGGRSIYLLSLTPPRIYGLLVANNLGVILWLYLWSWEYTVAAFIVVFSLPVTMYICFYTSLKQLFNNFAVLIQEETQSEIWVVRFLVQNALGFISAWQTIVMFLNLGVVLRYEVGISEEIIFLAVLGGIALLELVWFWLDVFVFDRYTRYILLTYIPWLATCGGLNWKLQHLFQDWGRDTITLFCCSVLALLCFTVKLVFLIYRHNITDTKQNANKNIEEKSGKVEEEKTELKNKACVTFAVENEQTKTPSENKKSGSEDIAKSNSPPKQCPVVPASEVQYNRIEIEEQTTETAKTVIVHNDAIESNAMESIQGNLAPPKEEVIMDEQLIENNSAKTTEESRETESQEKSVSETGEQEVLQPAEEVEEERVNKSTEAESEQYIQETRQEEEIVACLEEPVPEAALESEEVESEMNPPDEKTNDINVIDQIPNEKEIDSNPVENKPTDNEPVLNETASPFPLEQEIEETKPEEETASYHTEHAEPVPETALASEEVESETNQPGEISNDINAIVQIPNEIECRPLDNESLNSTTAQIDDPMEDFEVENEPIDNEPELTQTPPPLLEDEEYEGTYIVREPGLEGEYKYNPSETENSPQDHVFDETLPSPPISPASDPLPSPPTAPVSDGDEYDESSGEEAPPVPPQDYNMSNKSYQFSPEPIDSQQITTNGYDGQRRPESFGTVDTAV
ncbi:uncharacterized protein LOC125651844 isoform X2 [Ostrea edulis]|nr:uncharacterized protein LOC125651844 isoform X2 [Ostrea edulis]